NLIRTVRAEADQGYDRHSIQDNMGIWHKVQRALPNPYFKNESGTRCYVSLNDLNKKKLTAVYEGKLILWVTTTAPNIKDRYVQFKLWELTYEWLHRIGIVLDQLSNIKPDLNSFKVHIQFKDTEPEEVPKRKPTSDDLLKLCQIEQNVELNSCILSFEAGFIFGFNISQNTAEKIIVRKLTQAYLELLEVQDYEYTAESVEKMVVLNKEARNFHIFQAQTFIDFVRDSIPQALVSINELDDATAKIGLGWRILGKSKSNKVKGIKNCTKFLQKVVDHLLNEIFESLRSFERLSILKRLVANIERAYIKSEHWEKTSAAVLGLHGNNQNTINSYIKQISKYSGAKISSRVLIEIALCTSPLGTGINISDIELSKLNARVALLIRIGGLSDAIYYSALSPELKISPLGDILFCDDFGQMVVEPMLTHMLGDNYLNLAPLQKKNYEEHQVVGDTKSKFEDEFWQIWEAEMGFNIDEARKILDAIDNRGIQKNTAILTIKQSEFYKILNDENIDSRIAESFLDRFSLKIRPKW
ncbi:MAG: hypothetical protein KAR20_10890, partial [Candidatus Heimdallarchaeota archaeon]|nr:hypothetical protein [Candidatus Heimdallarchaeota archaeon]